MNVDAMLRVLNEEQVDYLLIGGMNFLIRHLPELTFDVDFASQRARKPAGWRSCGEAIRRSETQ